MSCDKDLSVPVGKGNYISVSSSEISSITTNSAKCSFIVNDFNNETVVEQGLCWEITPKPTTANKKIAVTLGTGTFPTNLTNLNPNQTYYVRSYVKLNTGATMYGDEKYFITKDILPATFRESSITNITATSAQVTGSILDNGGSTLSDVGVVYGYSTNPTIQDIRISAGASATSFTISLSGLIQNTTYNLRPYAINSKGVLSYGTNVLFQTLTITSANLLNGIVAYYPFNGNANDASGNSVNGTVNGPILASDRLNKINSAYNFLNGGYVRTSKPILNVFNNFTISFWALTKNQAPLKLQGFTSNQVSDADGPPIVHPTHGLSWDSQSAGVGVIFGTNQIQIIEHADNYLYFPLVYSGNFTNWNHITLVYENHIPKLFVNGTLVVIGIQSPKQLIRPSNGSEGWAAYSESGFGKSFAPGAFNSSKQFTGLIDDYAIWNRVLTANEIKDLYNTYELIK